MSIILRAFILLLSIAVGYFGANQRNALAPIIPLILFVLIYSYRMYDNYFVENYPVYVTSTLAFAMFFGVTIVPGLGLYAAAGHFWNSEKEFSRVMIGLMLIFLIGIWYSSDLLYERTTVQASLERVNQISMTSVATSFGLFSVLLLRQNNTITRALLLACLIGLAIVISIAKARGPLVGTIFALLGYFLLVRGRYKLQLAGLLAVGVIVIAAMQVYFGTDLYEQALSRFDYVEDGSAGDSITTRKLAWQAAWEQFLADPIIGRLMFDRYSNYYPHNIILEVLMATGVIGAFFFFWHLLQTLSAAKYLLRQNTVSIPQAFMVLMFFKEFVQSLFSGSVWGAAGFFITSCCLIGMAHYSRNKAKSNSGQLSKFGGARL